jgi:hypothetical protein
MRGLRYKRRGELDAHAVPGLADRKRNSDNLVAQIFSRDFSSGRYAAVARPPREQFAGAPGWMRRAAPGAAR